MNRNLRTLVALSATEIDRALVEYARILASMGFARHYHFVHIRTPASIAADLKNEAQVLKECENLVSEIFSGPGLAVTFSCHVIVGVRVDDLIGFATQQRCDMVLLGHRKSHSGQRSLARRLAMIAPCSVWLVPEGAPVSIANIMAPIDFSDHAADSLEVATSIAKGAGLAECTALHVFSDPSTIRYDEHLAEIRKNEQDSFKKFIATLDRHGVNVEPMFVEGNKVARTILHFAERSKSDLLVMNTRGRSQAASILLGSVTTQVMIESPIAVLAVKHFGAMMNLFQALQQSQFWTRNSPKTN